MEFTRMIAALALSVLSGAIFMALIQLLIGEIPFPWRSILFAWFIVFLFAYFRLPAERKGNNYVRE